GGTIASASVSASVNTNIDSASAYAVSLSYDHVDDKTKAFINGVDLGVTGGAAVKARNEVQVIGIGGAGSYTARATRVGGRIALNWLTAQTTAGIFGDTRRPTESFGGDVSISAIDDQTLWAFAVSVGVSGGSVGSGAGTAFTVGANILSSSSTVFGGPDTGEIR